MMRRAVLPMIVALSLASAPAGACTNVVVSDGHRVLAASNTDWTNVNTRVWFVPSSKEEYGRICFGFNDGIAQNGVNDRGLFVSCNTLPGDVPIEADPGKPMWEGTLVERILATCATVDEALALWDRYNIILSGVQYPIADRTGASAIVEYGSGTLNVLRGAGAYQIATNTAQSSFEPGQCPCPRYTVAARMLEETKPVSVDRLRAVLSATHMEGATPTVYSFVANLNTGDVYVYNFHDFEEAVRFNLREELAKGPAVYELPALFTREPFAKRQYLLSRPKPASDYLYELVIKGGVEKAIEKYHRLKDRTRETRLYDFGESQMNELGERLLREGRTDEAVSIFLLNVAEQPDNGDARAALDRLQNPPGTRHP